MAMTDQKCWHYLMRCISGLLDFVRTPLIPVNYNWLWVIKQLNTVLTETLLMMFDEQYIPIHQHSQPNKMLGMKYYDPFWHLALATFNSSNRTPKHMVWPRSLWVTVGKQPHGPVNILQVYFVVVSKITNNTSNDTFGVRFSCLNS